jgi:PKD repeat protein
MIRKLFYILSVFLLTPAFAHAGVQFSEVMYDPPGTNTGRQWVEIFNPDSQDADLSQWTFFQGGVNHKIVSVVTGQQDASNTPVILPAGAYAVIANDTSKFSIDWPIYNGLLFHSAFTLRASGETIALNLTQTGGQSPVQADQFTIDPSLGGQGDGKSLQKIGGIWVSGAPSPGIANNTSVNAGAGSTSASATTIAASQSAPQESITQSSTIVQSGTITQSGNAQDVIPQIFCNITSGQSYVTGVPGRFVVETWGQDKEPLINPTYLWNFGDGGVATEQNLFHTYYEPGTYIATLTVAAGKSAALCQLNVKVSSAEVHISDVQPGTGGFVELYNDSSQDVDVSGFILQQADTQTGNSKTFYFPLGSLIVPGQPVRFSAQTLGFAIDAATSPIQLLYPNGVLLSTYSPVSPVVSSQVAVSTSTTINIRPASDASIDTPNDIPKTILVAKKSGKNSVSQKVLKKNTPHGLDDSIALSSDTATSTVFASMSFASTSDSTTTVQDLASAILSSDDIDNATSVSRVWLYIGAIVIGIILLCWAAFRYRWKNGST